MVIVIDLVQISKLFIQAFCGLFWQCIGRSDFTGSVWHFFKEDICDF